METNSVTVQLFDDLRLEWAKNQFLSELRSDFQRSRTFDSFKSQRDIGVLLDRPLTQLEILARVLPLQVLPKTSTADKLLKSLQSEESAAVEKLRDDYQWDYIKHFERHVRDVARKNDSDAKTAFNAVTRIGNDIVKTTAARWSCEAASAARGE